MAASNQPAVGHRAYVSETGAQHLSLVGSVTTAASMSIEELDRRRHDLGDAIVALRSKVKERESKLF